MINSTEHGIHPAHIVKMPTIVGILTFIRRINKSNEGIEARNTHLFQHFNFYEQLKCYAQLS